MSILTNPPVHACNFCGRRKAEAEAIVYGEDQCSTGRTVDICARCVEACLEIVLTHRMQQRPIGEREHILRAPDAGFCDWD